MGLVRRRRRTSLLRSLRRSCPARLRRPKTSRIVSAARCSDRIDSAPWLRLIPVAISPSKQPPSRRIGQRHAGIIVAEEPGECVAATPPPFRARRSPRYAAAAASIVAAASSGCWSKASGGGIGPAKAMAADRPERAARARLLRAPASSASTRPRSIIAGSSSAMPARISSFGQAGIVIGEFAARTSPNLRGHSGSGAASAAPPACSQQPAARS